MKNEIIEFGDYELVNQLYQYPRHVITNTYAFILWFKPSIIRKNELTRYYLLLPVPGIATLYLYGRRHWTFIMNRGLFIQGFYFMWRILFIYLFVYSFSFRQILNSGPVLGIIILCNYDWIFPLNTQGRFFSLLNLLLLYSVVLSLCLDPQ